MKAAIFLEASWRYRLNGEKWRWLGVGIEIVSAYQYLWLAEKAYRHQRILPWLFSG
jgi:hypothetical protein